jgi:GNAT superfamily N-acetyltransferase
MYSCLVERYDNINFTPAAPLLFRAQHELMEAGFMRPCIMVFWDDNALVAFNIDKLPIGVISFVHEKWLRQISIRLGYVLPEWRRQGVYRTLWNSLVDVAKSLDVKEIQGNTHVDNTPMNETMKALGRTELGKYYVFKVS